jgi:hypothetical protein
MLRHCITLLTALPVLAAPKAVQPFLAEHCMDCHDAETKKGGFDLEALNLQPESSAAVHKKWVNVWDRVAAGEMPPKNKPDATELQTFLRSLSAELNQAHSAQKGTVLRRLNRKEYQNTLHDLLGVRDEVIDMLPEDGRAHGFENIGEALSLSGTQLQRYMEAADLLIQSALTATIKPEPKKESFTLLAQGNQQYLGKQWLKLPTGEVVVFNDGGYPNTEISSFKAKSAGLYKLTVTASGYQIKEPVAFCVITGTFRRGSDLRVVAFREVPADRYATVDLTVDLKEGDTVKISPQGLNGPDGHSPIKDTPAKYPGEGFALKEVTVEGPLPGEWPPRGQTLLLQGAKIIEVEPEKQWMRKNPRYKPSYKAEVADAAASGRNALQELANRAFRRPATAEEIAPYYALFTAEMGKSGDYFIAIRTAATALLCAPEFLYLKEAPGELNDYALAARLSYFLTRRAPDAELLSLAAADTLDTPSSLRSQTERLLSSPAAFVSDFTDGWLNLREIDFTTPDKLLYPEFDALLFDSMLQETRSFFTQLIKENLPVGNVVRSDFAMLNARLARHYELPPVSGLELRKVSLPADSRRGGLLTQAAILKVSANGTNTSPVVRGVWVNERILGIHPQPPPPGIPGVEPDIRGAHTLRELLAKHRSMESCNGCHRVIDPPGFALENYDVIGGWRDHFRSMGDGQRVTKRVEGRNVRYKLGPAVDAAGELTTGAKFTNLQELQVLLLKDEDRLAKNLLEYLLTFATGREMGFSDREEIDTLIVSSRNQKHGVRELIHAAVQSQIFLRK